MARPMPSLSLGENHPRLHPPLQRGRKTKGEDTSDVDHACYGHHERSPAVLAQADSQVLAARTPGYRDHELPSRNGGIEPYVVLIDSELRQAQARRPIDPPWRKPRNTDITALKQFCSTTFACVAFFNN